MFDLLRATLMYVALAFESQSEYVVSGVFVYLSRQCWVLPKLPVGTAASWAILVSD